MFSQWVAKMIAGLLLIAAVSQAQEDVWRFDCGTPKSPVAEGYQRLAAGETYNKTRGYGWEQGEPVHVEFRRPVRDLKLRGSAGQLLLEEAYDNHRDALNRDGVVGHGDLDLRATLTEDNQFGIDFTLLGGVDFLDVSSTSIGSQYLNLGPTPPIDFEHTTFNVGIFCKAPHRYGQTVRHCCHEIFCNEVDIRSLTGACDGNEAQGT